MTAPSKWGPEFLVNTTTSVAQIEPAIAVLAGGGFVVAWTDDSGSGGDTSGYAIRGQMFNADGSKSGGEFLVNTATASEQKTPAVTALADGGFVVAWQTNSQANGDTSGTATIAQIFNATGGRVGGEFLLNTTTVNNQLDVDGAALPNGRFVASWSDYGNGFDIWAQLFDADGAKFGIEFPVNTTATGFQGESAVAVSRDGIIAMAWLDESQTGSDTSGSAVRARLFNAVGIAFGPDFVVNSATAGVQTKPDIIALTNGNFLVTWQDFSGAEPDTSSSAIRAQVLKYDGSPIGAEFLVNTTTADSQTNPAAVALPDGRFVVTWEHRVNSDDSDVRAQVFNTDGSKFGDEFIINTEAASFQGEPAIAAFPDGRLVVAFTDWSEKLGDTSLYGIAAQIFDPRETWINVGGTSLDDQFVGTRFNDVLGGDIGNDRLIGGDGHDTLWGDPGADVLDGGAGNDTVRYVDSQMGVIVNLHGASLLGHAAGDVLTNIENVLGSEHSDILIGDDNDNILSGLNGDDSLQGGAGNDLLGGGAGSDLLDGGTGDDTYYVVDLGDQVAESDADGDSGTDTVVAALSYILGADVENLILSVEVTTAFDGTGNARANTITGNQYANTLHGAGGNDTLIGGTGNDTINGGADFDKAVFAGQRSQYTLNAIAGAGNGVQVVGPDGTDTLSNVEQLVFADQIVSWTNAAPVATSGNHGVRPNQYAQVTPWLSYSDPNGIPVVQYQFYDSGTAAGSGYFWTADIGQQPANMSITVAAADLATTWVRGGQVAGSDQMWVRAYNGTQWSDWDPFTLTSINTLATATINNHTVHNNEWVPVQSWISTSDVDGDPITQYQFYDSGTAAGSGYFWTADIGQQPADTYITVAAADLATTWVRGGQVTGSETLWVRAFDGFGWGAWDSFTFTTHNTAPVATIDTQNLDFNEWVPVQSWISTSDADGDSITQYQFLDAGMAADSGYFWTADIGQRAANEYITVDAADLATTWVRGGQVTGSELMWVRAFDGTDWSAWDAFTLNTSVV